MNQVIKMTDVEQMTMYMKLSKIELVNMLIQCNKVIDQITPIIDKKCNYFSDGTLSMNCMFCGKGRFEHE